MAAPPKSKRAARQVLGDGFPVPFADGPPTDTYSAICIFCFAENATVRLIEKGHGAGGYAVMCPICATTSFLCRRASVDAWRAYQALLRDPEARRALASTLQVMGTSEPA